jgi:hypothetical protein
MCHHICVSAREPEATGLESCRQSFDITDHRAHLGSVLNLRVQTLNQLRQSEVSATFR